LESLEFFSDLILPVALWPWGRFSLLTEMNTRDVSWEGKGGRCVGLTTLPPSCADCLQILGAWTSWRPKSPSRPVIGLLFTKFNIKKFCFLPKECIYWYVSFVDLRTKSDYFRTRHSLTGLDNRDGVWLLRGTNWVFNYNSVCGLYTINTQFIDASNLPTCIAIKRIPVYSVATLSLFYASRNGQFSLQYTKHDRLLCNSVSFKVWDSVDKDAKSFWSLVFRDHLGAMTTGVLLAQTTKVVHSVLCWSEFLVSVARNVRVYACTWFPLW
jgi:hypothetical protein